MMKAIINYSNTDRHDPNSNGSRRRSQALKTVIFTDKIMAIRETPNTIVIDTVDDSYRIITSDKTHIVDKITEFILSDTAPNILEINKPEQDNESVVDNDPPITS